MTKRSKGQDVNPFKPKKLRVTTQHCAQRNSSRVNRVNFFAIFAQCARVVSGKTFACNGSDCIVTRCKSGRQLKTHVLVPGPHRRTTPMDNQMTWAMNQCRLASGRVDTVSTAQVNRLGSMSFLD